VDLWEGAPVWESAPHRAIENHFCWLDVVVARHKMKEFQRQMPELVVSLVLLEFVKEKTIWVPVTQRALGGEVAPPVVETPMSDYASRKSMLAVNRYDR
jgi:hypothetical protein